MGWNNVPICDEHWLEEEGDRQPLRFKEAIRDPNERCYRCGRRTDGIFVRRNVPEANGTITATCPCCRKEVTTEEDSTLIVLGMTYDDVTVALLLHRECYKELDRVYIPPRMSDRLPSPAQQRLEELTDYTVEEYAPADRMEDV